MSYALNLKTSFLTTLLCITAWTCSIAQNTRHDYTEDEQEDLTVTKEEKHQEGHIEANPDILHGEKSHHNRYELEISYNNSGYFEFTGSIYFAHLTKFQGTVEFTGKHFASVVVREIPIGHSRWGTFVGIGGTFGYHDSHHEEGDHYIDVDVDDITHPDDYDNTVEDGSHREWGGSVIVQTGLAYSLNSHWSTGFTLSPGIDVQTGEPTFGATLDVVFGF
ncbi:hypothetical protein [Flammeovirga agarivorans]|uniref:Outer membrane protein beta-barrel domain-containing protein n=1 Tax=Flammeovirga agarivorans TaxID=2726742 RepID=A0A7X8XUK5_9BACT|nr:hypothetical protein [Flammeovirga agarivorans]NLR90215.1 hypothetical protein [Flammeovirga agarivorans]